MEDITRSSGINDLNLGHLNLSRLVGTEVLNRSISLGDRNLRNSLSSQVV